MSPTMKTIKVSAAHHRALKLASVERGVSLQQYLAFILELTFSEDPLLKDARDAYFHLISDHNESTLQMIKRLVPDEDA